MGKKGEALRMAKKQSARYTFTGEELEQHDKAVREAYKEDIMGRMATAIDEEDKRRKADIDAHINAVWAERAKEFMTGTQQGDAAVLVAYALMVSVRVLVDDFGWRPVRSRHRTRLQRFAEAVTEAITEIRLDEEKDIVQYGREAERITGVRFLAEDDDA